MSGRGGPKLDRGAGAMASTRAGRKTVQDDRRPGRTRDRGAVTWATAALAGVVLALLLMTAVALDTLSAARAYIAGESLWSKAQKNSVAALLRYSRTGNEGDYETFLTELEVPLGDRVARIEMEKPKPDLDVVRRGLLAGRNHPDDIDRMATFFRRFQRVPRVAHAIEIWQRGDRALLALLEQGERLREITAATPVDEAELRRVLDRVAALDEELSVLESGFATVMGDASRWAQRALFAGVAVSALALLFLALFIVHRQNRRSFASELSARQSEEKKRTVLDTIEDGYFDLDLEGRITFTNSGLCRILGRQSHEILGHHLREFVDPDSANRLLQRIAAVLRTGRPARAVTAAVLRPDGERRVIEASGTPLLGADGQPAGLCSVARDVTERRAQEEALRRSEAEYRGLFEHAPYGIYRSTPGGQLLSVNSALAFMLGYDSPEDLIGVSLGEHVYLDPTVRARLVAEHADREHVAEVEVEWKRRDGSPILVRLNGRRIRDDAGFDAFEMFVEDLTHRRALEAELRQAQKMQAIGQLTGGIAHDFNNLLTIIASTAELLAEDLPEEAFSARGDVDELRAAAGRGADMVRKLLAFSRRGQLHVQAVDLGGVVTDTVAMLRRVLPAHIEIVTDVPSPAPVVRGDRGALEQILLNLATNARDAMPQGGELSIRTDTAILDSSFCASHGGGPPGPYAVLVVSDTGIGMDDSTRERAFEPFFTTKAPGAGTGLGMSMIYGLVRQHDGFIDLQSELGRGTTLRIYVPAVFETPSAKEDVAPRVRPRGRETILIVEDEPAILSTGKRILERDGYTVLTASNGEDALALVMANGRTIDLVLSDVVMPRMGGAALFRAVRDAGLSVRFLFTSGYTEREVGGFLDAPAPVVAKPWSADELARRVREALDAPLPQALRAAG